MNSDETTFTKVEEINGIQVVRFHDLMYPGLHNGKSALLASELASIAEQDPRGVVLDFESRYFIPSATILTVFVRFHRKLDEKLRMCNLPNAVREHLHRNRLAEIFRIHSTLEEAIADFSDDVAQG